MLYTISPDDYLIVVLAMWVGLFLGLIYILFVLKLFRSICEETLSLISTCNTLYDCVWRTHFCQQRMRCAIWLGRRLIPQFLLVLPMYPCFCAYLFIRDLSFHKRSNEVRCFEFDSFSWECIVKHVRPIDVIVLGSVSKNVRRHTDIYRRMMPVLLFDKIVKHLVFSSTQRWKSSCEGIELLLEDVIRKQCATRELRISGPLVAQVLLDEYSSVDPSKICTFVSVNDMHPNTEFRLSPKQRFSTHVVQDKRYAVYVNYWKNSLFTIFRHNEETSMESSQSNHYHATLHRKPSGVFCIRINDALMMSSRKSCLHTSCDIMSRIYERMKDKPRQQLNSPQTFRSMTQNIFKCEVCLPWRRQTRTEAVRAIFGQCTHAEYVRFMEELVSVAYTILLIVFRHENIVYY
jgi:hypothetical protein